MFANGMIIHGMIFLGCSHLFPHKPYTSLFKLTRVAVNV